MSGSTTDVLLWVQLGVVQACNNAEAVLISKGGQVSGIRKNVAVIMLK